jgi:hypothetical protein
MPIALPPISMTGTLFGGLLLAALLFFAGRRLGLSGFWAGVLSGALPFLAYLVYSSQHWGGGDVLAIHFAVYIAGAGLLTIFGSLQRKNQKMHWAPRLILWFFVGLVVLNAILLSIASNGLPGFLTRMLLPTPEGQKVHTAFPGVLPHDRNKSYEPHLEKVERQRNLGWQVTATGFEALVADRPGAVTVAVKDEQGAPLKGAMVNVALWRMANSDDDRVVALAEIAPGVYGAHIALEAAGRWLMTLHVERGQDHHQSQRQLIVGDE